MNESMERTTVFYPKRLKRRLDTESKNTGKSQSVIFREALEEYLEKRPQPLPDFFGSVSNAELAAVDVDEYLEQHWRPD